MAKDNRNNYKKPKIFNIKPDEFVASQIAKDAMINDEDFCSELLQILRKYSDDLAFNYYNDFLHIVYDYKIQYSKAIKSDEQIKNFTIPMLKELEKIRAFTNQFLDGNLEMYEIVVKGNKETLKLKQKGIIDMVMLELINILNKFPADSNTKFTAAKKNLKAESLTSAYKKSAALRLLTVIVMIELFPIDEGSKGSNIIYSLIGELMELAGMIDRDKITSNLPDYVVSLLR